METFVVRVWTQPEPVGKKLDPLHGRVEHLGSGQAGTFTDDEELLAFLRGNRRTMEREQGVGRTQ